MKRPSIIQVLLDAYRGYHRYLAGLIVLGIVSALLDGIGINMFVPIVSFFMGSGSPTAFDTVTNVIRSFFAFIHIPFTFRYLLGFTAALFLLRAVVLAAFSYVRAKIAADFTTRESNYLMRKVLSARWSFLVREKVGHLLNTVFWDVRRDAWLLDALAQLIQSVTGFVIYLLIALNLSPAITLATLVAGVILVLASQPVIKKLRKVGDETATIEKEVVHQFGEYLGGVKVVKASGITEEVASRAHKLMKRFERAYVENAFVQSLGTSFTQPFAFIFILGIFAFAYRLPSFSLATFAATIYLIQKIFTYLQTAQGGMYTVVQYVPYAANVSSYKAQLASEAEQGMSGTQPFAFEKEIAFEHVSLSYGDKTALEDISFAVKRGAFVGVIGPSGAGKTSLADIVLRLHAPEKGRVVVDGVPLSDIALLDWRANVAYVPQDPILINGTLEENIRFFRSEHTMEELITAAKQAHIYDHIASLPEGFSTLVGDRGATLSGGERQRIALARALLGRPCILVLDEATSALDTASEQAVAEAIRDLHGRVTVFAIAHRLSTIEHADHLIVLEKGRLVEQGAPQALAADASSYFAREKERGTGGADVV